MIKRSQNIILDYQPIIDRPPMNGLDMQKQAASNDRSTIDFWRDIWLRNLKDNKKRIGSFKDNGIQKLHNCNRWKPAIVIGAGPSIRFDAPNLVKNDELKIKGNPGILTISCLHNFAYLEDLGVHIDYYVTLDAGEIVIDEMFHGGKKDRDFYIERSKECTVLCYVATNPRFFENWKGKVYWFNSVMPDLDVKAKYDEVEKFNVIVSGGGNVLGASMYIAKGIMGSNPIAFLGADFSFGYDNQFHAFESGYDNIGQGIKITDIFGHKVNTWPSYYNFKLWMDLKASTVPGLYVNCSSGGCFGSYDQGNIKQVIQMPLESFLEIYRVSNHLEHIWREPDKEYDSNNALVLF